jgi:60Kd inner membrane protein
MTERRACEVNADGPPGPMGSSTTVSSAISMGLEVGLRNWRSPGARLLGIRRVDAATGGPISIRSIVIHHFAARLLSAPFLELARPLQRREMERMQELAPLIAELRREHADDQEAMERAMMEFYAENRVNPLRSCLWVPGSVLAVRGAIFLSSRGQPLPDRLAGIVVVRD